MRRLLWGKKQFLSLFLLLTPIVFADNTSSYEDFARTHAIIGIESTRTVKFVYRNMMKHGWQGKPIKVADIDGVYYIFDGHHRFFSAKKAGIPVEYEIVPEENWIDYFYRSADEILSAADYALDFDDDIRL